MTPPLSDTERRTDGPESDHQTDSHSDGEVLLEQSVEERVQDATVCVVGLGYVGLPLAVGFAQADYRVIGFDVDDSKVETLQNGVDTTGDLSDDDILDGDVTYTTDDAAIRDADYVLVTVPTPVEEERPNLAFIESAAETVGEHVERGTTVVLESTVYPGVTREVFAPAIEDASGLEAGEDFFVGYSPERATPGDGEHSLESVVKVVGGQNEAVREDVATLYESVVDAGIHRASSLEVAEASKVIENVQRDVNIALMNELSMVFEEMDLDTHEVLEAAGTKWNFHDYRPGLVGGHCIPVDPYFFAHRAKQVGANPELVLSSRKVNESMPEHVSDLMIKALNEGHNTLRDSRVLVLGLTYKRNVADIRSSKVANVIDQLKEFDVDIVGYDPHADDDAVEQSFGIDVQDSLSFEEFDGVLLATPHSEFDGIDLGEMAAALNDDAALVDVAGGFDADDATAEGLIYRGV
ncbi:nucleotide sugar dehydrogenase [Natronococcus pandeyae]|uniref:UDP-N-acetyl-D-mannosamine dehydrogenase n=1 Tax=Natronococcus pandeyae TaxID=2055836 RepID=A0A8J8Q3H6_9EURY|nr:nucleotide sugar dehydrogenase [Natronococcus pandeyae]TYL39500.1 nucleotide sugar dehydrogenase [Natronococcus pandeyae]